MSKSFKEQSKINWSPCNDREATHEEIKIGCLQRIAEATEVMARNYNALLSDLAWQKQRVESLLKDRDRWQRSSNARAGVIKKLKGKKL